MSKLNWKNSNQRCKDRDFKLKQAVGQRIKVAARTVFCWRCQKEEPYDPKRHVLRLSANLNEHGKPKRYYKCNPSVKVETTAEWQKRLFG